MGSLLSHSVEIQISNRTRDVHLGNPRMHLEHGSCSELPRSECGPRLSDNCLFPGAFPFWGVAGILVYEAESFTLAIYFYNPINYNRSCMELGLELSLSKAHWGNLANIYTHMAYGTYSSSCLDIKFDRVIVDASHGIIQLSDGPVKVTVTMSYTKTSTLKVVLEEQLRTERRSQY